jgi:predicted metal-binding membrane protein
MTLDDRPRLNAPKGRASAAREGAFGVTAPHGSIDVGLRRDSRLLALALVAITALAWAYLVAIAVAMHAQHTVSQVMTMSSEAKAAKSAAMTWSKGDFLEAFVMWSVMMVAMMTPTAAPTFLTYSRYGRLKTSRQGTLSATAWFVVGYLLVWIGFALIATILQWRLERPHLLDPVTLRGGRTFDGVLLLAAGLYQLTPLKSRSLRLCQAPGNFIRRHGGFQRTFFGSLALGLRHGLYCVASSWCLMLLLFVGGLMNLVWVAGLSGFILLEKIMPNTRLVSRIAALGLVATGDWMFFLILRSVGMH